MVLLVLYLRSSRCHTRMEDLVKHDDTRLEGVFSKEDSKMEGEISKEDTRMEGLISNGRFQNGSCAHKGR